MRPVLVDLAQVYRRKREIVSDFSGSSQQALRFAPAGRTGWVPNSDTLNLSAAGIEVNLRGFIRVNGRLET
ncbi:MAG TPA: hypothetical protein ENI60_04925 [Candidatus Fraserbacteria bacterium]|nr:hypothetical protein [Candidatus Fraserbacteria bacterium]